MKMKMKKMMKNTKSNFPKQFHEMMLRMIESDFRQTSQNLMRSIFSAKADLALILIIFVKAAVLQNLSEIIFIPECSTRNESRSDETLVQIKTRKK
jgi:hypothetical protein